MAENSSTKTYGGPGKRPELSPEQRRVMRELRGKGRTLEQLAVGFGVSYNTVRAYLAELEAMNEETPATSTCAGLSEPQAEPA